MKRQPQSESGFALLFIFVLAAGIAIGMLLQLPRVAFETARNREELLIERGEQYKRGVALYFRKTNRLPAKLEDLENTNNIRFLRKRYIDPMTGKDEWRIIHAGAGGVLTDSLVQKPPALGDGKDSKGGTGTTQSGQNFGLNPGNTVGAAATGAPGEEQTVNAAVLRRPSDRVVMTGMSGSAPASFDPNQPPPAPGSVPAQPIYPGQPGYPQPGTPGYTGQPLYPGQPGYPAQAYQQQAYGGTGQPIYPGQPGYPAPGTPGYTGQPIYPGQPGYSQGGQMGQPVYPQGGQMAQPIYPGQPGYPAPGTPGYTGQPIYPGQPGYSQMAQSGQPIYPGQPGYPPPGTPGYTGQPIYPGQPGYPPTRFGQPGQPFNPMQNVPGVVNAQQGGFNQPGMPQYQQPGQQGYNPSGPAGGMGNANPAVGMINDILRNPRNPPPGVGGAFNNTGIQGGIAGFASTFKGPSIKIYKERQKYQEWEFVYDIKDDPYLKQRGGTSGQGLGGQGLGGQGLGGGGNRQGGPPNTVTPPPGSGLGR